MLNKKYGFTGETIQYKGRLLRRIRRLSDGRIGGFIESEENLSHEGSCFIHSNSNILGDTRISGDLIVLGNAYIYGDAYVTGDVSVNDNVTTFYNVQTSSSTEVPAKKYEFTGEIIEYKGRLLRRIRRLSDNLLGGYIESEENLSHEGPGFVYEDAKVYADMRISGDVHVYGNGNKNGSVRAF